MLGLLSCQITGFPQQHQSKGLCKIDGQTSKTPFDLIAQMYQNFPTSKVVQHAQEERTKTWELPSLARLLIRHLSFFFLNDHQILGQAIIEIFITISPWRQKPCSIKIFLEQKVSCSTLVIIDRHHSCAHHSNLDSPHWTLPHRTRTRTCLKPSSRPRVRT